MSKQKMKNIALKKKMKNIALAACVAGAFTLAVPVTASAASNSGNVPCYGVNSCKGMGACKTASNSCKGQNSCKGMGLTMMSASACTNAGGTIQSS